MLDWPFRRERAGRYALRRYKELRKQWERRTFPHWRRYLVGWVLLLVIVAVATPSPWNAILASLAGASIVVAPLVIETLVPDHINRWERGAFGEQYTEKELKRLRKDGWAIRHDLQTRYGNRDHVVVGPGVYLLETKNFTDSEVTLEGEALRVRRIDQPSDTYLLDGLTRQMEQRARSMWRELRAATGVRVYVHPVVVLWARFPEGEAYARGVAYVAGDRLAKWLAERPHELRGERRRTVADWLRRLPREMPAEVVRA